MANHSPAHTAEGDWKLQLVSEPKTLKTQYMNYARVAKKVDVKRLKENIWHSLQETSKVQQTLQTDNSTQQESISFTSVVHDLKPQYPEKKWKDISVAFCFICLLHLANENDLEICSGGSNEHQDILSKGVNTELLIKNMQED